MSKVSVIVLIYNTSKFLDRCVRSLMEQTLTDIEYVFVDDASTDDSMTVLKKVLTDYPEKKEDIKLIRNERNLGQAKSRIKAIEATTGEYVIHCDSDDYVDQTMYEVLYNKAVNEHLDLVWCDFFRTDGKQSTVSLQGPSTDSWSFMKEILTGRRMGTLWCHLIKGNLVREHDYLAPASNLMEDVVLLMQYAYRAHSFGYVNRPLYYYYHSETSITQNTSPEKMLWQVKEMDKNITVIIGFLNKVGEDRNLCNHIDYRKFFNKRWLLPIIDSPKKCRLWLEEYPEINRSLFFNPLLTKWDKAISFLVETRLYPLLRKIIRGR